MTVMTLEAPSVFVLTPKTTTSEDEITPFSQILSKVGEPPCRTRCVQQQRKQQKRRFW